MKRNGIDPKSFDYIWKVNRLSKDKEALKNSMLDVIRKKPKMQHDVASNLAVQGPGQKMTYKRDHGVGQAQGAGPPGGTPGKKDSQLAMA